MQKPAGNMKEAKVFVLAADKVKLCNDTDMKQFRMAIRNLGLSKI